MPARLNRLRGSLTTHVGELIIQRLVAFLAVRMFAKLVQRHPEFHQPLFVASLVADSQAGVPNFVLAMRRPGLHQTP